jgi:hypothetical protein
MIHADKNYLKATLNVGILQIQSRLIDLYVDNLRSLGTIASLIAALAMKGVIEMEFPLNYEKSIVNEHLYYFFNVVSFALAAYATSQSMYYMYNCFSI